MQTVSGEKGVGFWDVQSDRLLTNLDSPDHAFGSVMKYSPDGKMLALANDNILQVRDARSLSLITNLVHDIPFAWPGAFRAESIAFSGNLMAAGYRYGEIKIWDTRTWTELASWRAHSRFLLALDFSPDGKLLASGASDCRIQVWESGHGVKGRNQCHDHQAADDSSGPYRSNPLRDVRSQWPNPCFL
jgi:WD40 repeat protein